jgi:hypothetical protein
MTKIFPLQRSSRLEGDMRRFPYGGSNVLRRHRFVTVSTSHGWRAGTLLRQRLPPPLELRRDRSAGPAARPPGIGSNPTCGLASHMARSPASLRLVRHVLRNPLTFGNFLPKSFWIKRRSQFLFLGFGGNRKGDLSSDIPNLADVRQQRCGRIA